MPDLNKVRSGNSFHLGRANISAKPDFRSLQERAQSHRLSAGNIEMMLDSVTDPPIVIAAVKALNPKMEIVPVVRSHKYTTEPSGLDSRILGVGGENRARRNDLFRSKVYRVHLGRVVLRIRVEDVLRRRMRETR